MNIARYVGSFALIVGLSLGVASVANAKCFAFSDSDAVVCIDGNDNATRRQATEVCEDATGSDCGNITGYSGSCRSSGDRQCYDASGDEVSSASAD